MQPIGNATGHGEDVLAWESSAYRGKFPARQRLKAKGSQAVSRGRFDRPRQRYRIAAASAVRTQLEAIVRRRRNLPVLEDLDPAASCRILDCGATGQSSCFNQGFFSGAYSSVGPVAVDFALRDFCIRCSAE